MSGHGRSRRRRHKTKINDKQIFQDILNPIAENVTIQNVQIGGTYYEAHAQPSTSKRYNKKGEDDARITKYENKKTAIRRILKNLYETLTLPSLPWIDEDADVPMRYFTKLQLELEGEKSMTKIIELHDLFDVVDEKNPRRILIESQPGFGKTTLTHKIISDWVSEKNYIKRFKFAVLIVLRSLKTRTLKDEIIKTINNKDKAKGETWKIINDEETLLILDGLDEASKNAKSEIVEILVDAKNEYKMTIVTTCRTGLSRLKREDVDSIFRGLSVKKEFWCKKIAILGISDENQDEFLGNFVEEKDKDKMMTRLHGIIESLTNDLTNDDDEDDDYYSNSVDSDSADDDDDDDDDDNDYCDTKDLFKSPLMLILLVYVTREEHEIKIKTRTDLYKQFVDFIIRRTITKTDSTEANINFTLFDSSVNEYSCTFHKFGEMCWEHILNDELQFNNNSDTEAIHQMGFLLKHETKKKLGTVVHYEGFHLTILEFAAAVFLKEEFQGHHNRFCDHVIEEIMELCIDFESSSLVIPFLCGLLGNDVAFFFDQLSDCYVKYWIDKELLESILRECVMNKSIRECVRKNVPPYFKIYSSNANLTIIDQHSQIFLEILDISMKYLLRITQPLNVRFLICDVDKDTVITDTDVLKAGENITCESLVFALSHLADKTFISTLTIFENFSSRDKILRVDYISKESRAHLRNVEFKDLIKSSQFDLFADIHDDEDVDVIAKIIECNRVTNVCLRLSIGVQVLRSLGNIDTLSSLSIINNTSHNLDFDFDSVAENTEKKGEFLLFHAVKLDCKAQVNSNHHVKSLSINADNSHEPWLVRDANVMLSVVPTTLRCKSRALEVLNNDPEASSWAGWDEIVELTLSIGELLSEECVRGFNNFSRFKNLKILTLEFLESFGDKLDVTNIIENIGFLTLYRLEIRWFSLDYYEDIIRRIQNLILQNKISSISAISFVIIENFNKIFSDDRFNLDLITSALQCDGRISFTLFFQEWVFLRKFVKKFIPDLLNFNLKFPFLGNSTAHYNSLSFLTSGTDSLICKDIHKLELLLC